MDRIIVKRATLQEVDIVSQLLDHYRCFHKRGVDYALERPALERMLEQQDCIVLVAVTQDRGSLHYVGYACMCPVAADNGEVDWGLTEMYVVPEASEHGVERALLKQVVSYSKCKDTMQLLTDACNRDDAMKNLYNTFKYA